MRSDPFLNKLRYVEMYAEKIFVYNYAKAKSTSDFVHELTKAVIRARTEIAHMLWMTGTLEGALHFDIYDYQHLLQVALHHCK